MKKSMENINIVEQVLNKTKEEISKIKPVNILIVGKTGVGKSTLINNLFREKMAATGIGKPVTKHIRKLSKEGVPLVLYDTRGLELKEDTQHTAKEEILETIRKQKAVGKEDEIHLVYYCINANSSRIEQAEIDIIQLLSKQVPVIVVLTQAIGEQAVEFKNYLEELNLNAQGVVSILAEDFPVTSDYTVPAYGLDELLDLTFSILPEETHQAFNNAQQVDIQRKARSARKWATTYIATSFGVGFSPIPFSDASILVPMQVGLLAHITAIFGISIDKSTIASIIAAVGGTGGATFAGRYIVSNLIKFIPGAGTIAGGVISGATASLITSALAMSYIEVLSIIAQGEKEGKYPDLKNIKALMNKELSQRLKKKNTENTEKKWWQWKKKK